MRHTLRRSCAACAKSKHSCDLRTPRCSRCVKRRIQCAYANEPLTGIHAVQQSDGRQPSCPETEPSIKDSTLTFYNRFGSVDPFDSYPQTRLPREHVQRLMHSFLHKIAFQYYPLDLSPISNPFLISWWPLALGDPTLFHVSLQTASLDEELFAQKGFQTSDILMADSIMLLRRRVEDASLAAQDATMNSVITLAAIEFGKGNTDASRMHVDGVKRLVGLRGGISAVRQTSPLTARMVSWVSMIVTGQPQFDTQDDHGIGHGVPPIPAWRMRHFEPEDDPHKLGINLTKVEHGVRNVFIRLRHVFHHAQHNPLPSTRLHDLACFAVHRLLLSVPDVSRLSDPSFSECIRHATALYMFIIQGPTYFSHAVIVKKIVSRLIERLEELDLTRQSYDSVEIWACLIGLVSSSDIADRQWFSKRATARAQPLQLKSWKDVSAHVTKVLWLDTSDVEAVFRAHWEACTGGANKSTGYV